MVTTIKKGSKPKIKISPESNKNRPFPASKFTGKLKAEKDPVQLQKHLRDEWTKPAG